MTPFAPLQGMYVKPNWTIARCCGSLAQVLWRRYSLHSHDELMLSAASGFVLGEGVMSAVTAGLAAASS